MRCLAKTKAETGIWMEDAPIPAVGHNDVLIKISKTAICGTDVHIYNWDTWSQQTIPVPMTIGHEFAGKIVEIGSEVEGLKVGDRVSGEGHITCGHCRNCRAGRRHLCRNSVGVGVNRTGSFAEYLAIPATNAFPLSDSISDEMGAILDPFGNAAHTALSFDLVGEDVLITGAGPIGIMATAICRHVGARHVVVTDINEYRLDLAKRMGATRVVNVARERIDDVMPELGMTEGFDIGLEMSGNEQAIADLMKAMNFGAKVALLGLLPGPIKMDWNEMILKGLFVKGIYGREMFETWYKMTAMLETGLDLSPIITHRFPIEEFQQGFDAMRSGQSGKVILDWT